MKRPIILLFGTLVLFHFSCSPQADPEEAKQEVLNTEKAFNEMAAREGVKEAFLEFAAEDAVLIRQGEVVKGKQAIKAYFERQTLNNVRLEWKPEFIDVSGSGDLAYTYGPFTFAATDSTGQEITSKGIFHTVWKRQEDGTWKYVYD